MAVFPPATVRQLAFQRDYREIDVAPNDRGHMLRFSHPAKRGCGGTSTECGPVKICVYFTTGKVSTSLEHPRAGKGQLQRSVGDITMLARVFDNPRVHSNTGYHKTEETRKRHKENGLNPKRLIPLALDRYKCSLVPGPPQDRNKVVVLKHPTNIRIRIWLNTGTLGILHKDNKEIFVKKLTMSSIESYLENPLLALEEKKPSVNPEQSSSYSTYRPPLSHIQASTSSISGPSMSPDTRPLCDLDKAALISLAAEAGFSLTGTALNTYLTTGTVMIQGKGVTETKKNCSVADFLELLGKIDKDISRNSTVQEGTTEKETALMKAIRMAGENAAQLYR